MASAALFSSLGFQPVGVYDWAKIQGWRRANVSYRPLLDPGSSLVEQWHVLFAVRNWDCDHTLNSDTFDWSIPAEFKTNFESKLVSLKERDLDHVCVYFID